MMKLKNVLTLVALMMVVVAANAQKKVKNVVFMIGDGMGVCQTYAAQTQKGNLSIFKMPYIGLVRTNSANNYITDSAAAGTALSSGVKTKNGMLGCTPDTIPSKSIMEVAKKNGMATGIGVTCSVTHATPAAYYAHQPNREMHEEIALDFLASDIDICIGGGREFFENRKDKQNLTKTLKTNGYKVIYNINELNGDKNEKILGLLADEHLPMMSKGRGDILPRSTEFILNQLDKDNNNGFFVMIEGSQIDWGGHANDQEYIINEVVDFDNAVKKAIDFAKNDGNTLVIVTADHETGGFTLIGGDIEKKEVIGNFSTGNHSATPVPVYAYGPGAENFTGYFDNTEFKNKILTLLGID